MSQDKSQLTDMLSDTHKGIGGVKGVLTKLFRQTLSDLNVNTMVWNQKMTNYLKEYFFEAHHSGKDRSQARGNLNKALKSDPISIRTFCRGLQFLGARKVRFEIQIDWGKKNTVHGIALEFDDSSKLSPLDGELDDDDIA